MSRFIQVEDRAAGPGALGILVPPGRQTLVILRPRALPWDLVLTKDAASLNFREIFREEAGRAVDAIQQALVNADECDVSAQQAETGAWIRCRLGRFHFLACQRLSGQPYQPYLFVDAEQVKRTTADLRAILLPSPDCVQEIYCNTRHFEK
jgi:hypothetical protein